MSKKLAICIININNLGYTKDCINDLLIQNNDDFIITLVDQGSTERGTKTYLKNIEKHNKISVIRNTENVSINKICNEFKNNQDSEYLCLLNNDVRLTDNFVDDTINILDNNPDVGIVAHAQNSWKYNKKLNELEFRFTERKTKQGVEFTIRKSIYDDIPSTLLFQFGDDWLFHHTYVKNYKVAMCLSSPIIHYGSKSAQYAPMPFYEEEVEFNKLGLIRYLPHYSEYSEVKPTYINFGDEPIKTIIILGISQFTPSFNINGHFENKHITELNSKILNEIQGQSLLTTLPSKEQILNLQHQGIKDSIQLTISVEINNAIENGHTIWGWDDPRTISTLPLFLEHIPNPEFVVFFNKDEEIADYMINENPNLSYDDAMKSAKNYNLKIIEFLFNWTIKKSF